MGARTYRAGDFIAAARRLGVSLTVGCDLPHVLTGEATANSLTLDFRDPESATAAIRAFHSQNPLNAVVSVDDSATALAARASAALGLAGNPEESVRAAANKKVFREITDAMGLPTPWYREVSLLQAPEPLAETLRYPCVIKPLFLSAGRGVIRADDPGGFVQAFRRVARLLARPEYREQGGALSDVALSEVALSDVALVEGFIPGPEVALEGIVVEGRFQMLAFFDKPDPLDGPYFEETLLITPSRHPVEWQSRAIEITEKTVAALGLRTGAVHAELRMNGGAPVPLEIAPRSIGGHCSRILRFGAGMSLEELILRQALGMAPESPQREDRAAGVMMIPIPAAGVLRAVRGLEQAAQVPAIDDVEIAIPIGQQVVPPPEGDRYLGFIFAHAQTPDAVEAALRQAHAHLHFDIDSGD